MENIFKNIELTGIFKDAFEETTKDFNLSGEDKELLEIVAGIVKVVSTLEKTPLQVEIATLKDELNIYKDEARKLKAKVNALEEVNKKLTIENSNLLGSLKALKEISVAEDKIEEVKYL